jgi:hypothetical protein
MVSGVRIFRRLDVVPRVLSRDGGGNGGQCQCTDYE